MAKEFAKPFPPIESGHSTVLDSDKLFKKKKRKKDFNLNPFSPNLYSHPKYKRWRYKVFSRDKHMCQWPGCHWKGYVEAHHIWKKSKYPDKMLLIDNGITLCKEHHDHVTGREDEFIDFFTNILRSKALEEKK